MRNAFTLIELLVVITIIVVLLALLTPAMDRAVGMAERAKCLVNQRTVTVALSQYTLDHKMHYPPNTMTGQGVASAYDMRSPWNGNNAFPMSTGLLVVAKLLPATQLGKVFHCPTFDDLGNPNASGHNIRVIRG